MVVVRMPRPTFHQQCAPAAGTFTALPAANAEDDVKLGALVALEKLVVARSREVGVTKELDRKWERYEGIRELALRPGTDAEGVAAMRRALKELVDMAF